MREFRVGDKIRPRYGFPDNTKREYSLDIDDGEIENGDRSDMLEIYRTNKLFTVEECSKNRVSIKEGSRYNWDPKDFILATKHNKGGKLL